MLAFWNCTRPMSDSVPARSSAWKDCRQAGTESWATKVVQATLCQ
jgi:hypothetical protein